MAAAAVVARVPLLFTRVLVLIFLIHAQDPSFAVLGGVLIRGAGTPYIKPITDRFSNFLSTLTTPQSIDFEYKAMGGTSGLCRLLGSNKNCDMQDLESFGSEDVDFSASMQRPDTEDLFGEIEYLKEDKSGVFTFPVLSIGTVPVANLGDEIHSASNETMSLNLDVLADIFAGVITNWNDSRIIDSLLNGGSPTMATMLPNATINIALNSEVAVWMQQVKLSLATYSAAFQALNDTSDNPIWSWLPNATYLAGENSLASYILLTENSIGFMPLPTAQKFNHHVMKVIHEGGNVVEISTDSLSFSIIESGATLDGRLSEPRRILTNTVGVRGLFTWPFISYIFVSLRTNEFGDNLRAGASCETVRLTYEFWKWALTSEVGKTSAELAGAVILPAMLSERVVDMMERLGMCNGTLVLQQATTANIVLSIYAAKTFCLWNQLSSSQFLFQGVAGFPNGVVLPYVVGGCKDHTALLTGIPENESLMMIPSVKKTTIPQEFTRVPLVVTFIAVIANLNSVAGISKEFVLTKQILVDIMQGNLTQWNDTRLSDLNPDFASINEDIRLIIRCDKDDYSLALEEILDITLCENNSSAHLTVESYEEMQARASITPFSLGYVASFADRIEYTLDNFQVAAFQVEVVSPPPPSSPLLSSSSNMSLSSNSSTQYQIVSILQTTDRLQALTNCLDGTFDPEALNFDIHSSLNPGCYPLSVMLEAVFDLMFAQKACESSFEPLVNYLFIQLTVQSYSLPLYAKTFAMTFPSPFTPPDLVFQVIARMESTAKCGDELLLTSDTIDSESVHIDSGDIAYIVVLVLTIFITLLIIAALVILSINFHNPALKVAGVPEMIVFSSLLMIKLWFSVFLLMDPEAWRPICHFKHTSYALGALGTSSLLFFRLVRVYHIHNARGLQKALYGTAWVMKRVAVSFTLAYTAVKLVNIDLNPLDRMIISLESEEVTKFFSTYTSTKEEFIYVCNRESIKYLIIIGTEYAFLISNLLLAIPLWSIKQKYSDARIVILTSIQILVVSVPDWGMYFTWRSDRYNTSVILATFANICNCLLTLCLFIFTRLSALRKSNVVNASTAPVSAAQLGKVYVSPLDIGMKSQSDFKTPRSNG